MIPVGVASEGAPWRQNTVGSTFDDDYEPVRPSMTDSGARQPPLPPPNMSSSNRNQEDDESFEAHPTALNQQAIINPRTGNSGSISRQMINRTRVGAIQNYQNTQNLPQSRQSNSRQMYNGQDNFSLPNSSHGGQRGMTTDRNMRTSTVKNSLNSNQYYMMNTTGPGLQRGNNTNIPIQPQHQNL